MNERIKQIRKSQNMTQATFASALGLSRNFIAQLEMGIRVPSDRTIADICRKFNISEEWLRTGNGEMISLNARSFIDQLAREKGLTEPEKMMIEKFVGLPDDKRAAILEYVRSVAEAMNQTDSETSAQRQARLLREEAEAVEQEEDESSVSPSTKNA